MRASFLAIAGLLSACGSADPFADVDLWVDAEWTDGLPPGIEATALQSNYAFADLPQSSDQRQCGNPKFSIARQEPAAFWIQCEIAEGGAEIHLFEASQGEVVETILTVTMTTGNSQ